ncbi:MAG: glycosyltransferase family 4 protein [Atribacterota bacterium]
MKILLLPDKERWAYDRIARSIVKWNNCDDVDIHVVPIKRNAKKIKNIYKKYDRTLVMGWQNYQLLKFLPKHKTMVGIHSFHAWDEGKSQPNHVVNPNKDLIEFLNKFQRINAVSTRLFKLFKKHGVKKIFYTPNGVDHKAFKPVNHKHKGFVVGYSGASSSDWRKGVSEFIIPAIKKSKTIPSIAMARDKTYVPMEKMPHFYNELDCYVCASSSEGFSLSVLEAASSGVPIISTRVSGTEELIIDGKNGFLVDRDVNAIADKITLLKKNKNLRQRIGGGMRKHVVNKYSWEKRAKTWIDFICKKG